MVERVRLAIVVQSAGLGPSTCNKGSGTKDGGRSYIKPRSPQLNGKFERFHGTDEEEFYQLLSYKGDVDLQKILAQWERYYNLDQPHGAHSGKSPYGTLRSTLK